MLQDYSDDMKLTMSESNHDIQTLSELETYSINPWPKHLLAKQLKRRNVYCLALKLNTDIVGFTVIEAFKDYFQVLDFIVHPTYRRFGFGTVLMDGIKEKLQKTKRKRIQIDVREINLELQLFLRSCGFRCTEIINNFFKDNDDTCYKIEYREHWPDKVTVNDKKGMFARASAQELIAS